MGKQLPWGHKHLHIEAEKKHANHYRGVLKKGERRKGKKARIDELLSMKKTLERYAKWIVKERERRIKYPEWYKPVRLSNGVVVKPYNPNYEEWFDRHKAKQVDLVNRALKDQVITVGEVADYLVPKP